MKLKLLPFQNLSDCACIDTTKKQHGTKKTNPGWITYFFLTKEIDELLHYIQQKLEMITLSPSHND